MQGDRCEPTRSGPGTLVTGVGDGLQAADAGGTGDSGSLVPGVRRGQGRSGGHLGVL